MEGHEVTREHDGRESGHNSFRVSGCLYFSGDVCWGQIEHLGKFVFTRNEFEIIIFGSRIFHIFPILQRVIMFSLVYIFEQRGSPASFGAGAQSGERQRRGFGINSLILSAGFYRWPAIFVVAVCSRMISLLAHFLRSVSRNALHVCSCDEIANGRNAVRRQKNNIIRARAMES